MGYATLMVHLELGRSNAGLLKIVADLAERCAANILAVAVSQPLLATTAAADYICGEVVEQDQVEIDREAREAETEFRDLLANRAAKLDWRCASIFTPLADYVASQTRSADLIVTAPDRGASRAPVTRRVKIGDLILQAGRPVLLVPESATRLPLDRVLLAWKDSRETRRAALDALPLLELAGQVIVAEVVHEKEIGAASARLADVIQWLALHGIPAEPLVRIATGSDAAMIADIAHAVRADTVVAGAYGHNRAREWVFGGVTSDLLISPSRPTLLSH